MGNQEKLLRKQEENQAPEVPSEGAFQKGGDAQRCWMPQRGQPRSGAKSN